MRAQIKYHTQLQQQQQKPLISLCYIQMFRCLIDARYFALCMHRSLKYKGQLTNGIS